MTILLIITLCGINIAPFIFPQLDIWHAQGIWTQGCIGILFSLSFILKPKNKSFLNIELGILHLWIALFTGYICFTAQTHGKYDITHFFPYFNFLCLLMFYRIITEYLTEESLNVAIEIIRYFLIATLVLCVLQYFNMAQFFKLYQPDNQYFNNPVTGFIGNGTHLSGYLAMLSPIFLYRGKREDYLCLILMLIILCLTGTSTNDPSISGWVVLALVFSFWFFINNLITKKIIIIAACIVTSVAVIAYINRDAHWFNLFTSSSGRTGFWLYYINYIKDYFITGAGLGSMNAIYKDSIYPNTRFLHMEYLQFLMEIGFIGLIAIIALIRKFFVISNVNKTAVLLKTIVFGFLVSCCFNFPAHLWLTSTTAMFCYAAYLTLYHQKRDTYARII